ncbi:hypothetical protein Y032_0141g2238 [Ancylostoma ceylanicum]|uniref:Uncharacterized protein n=1 Tax=Ancylostoma ceylanicum TaxID=53326 RepID=A0A016T3X1_9BILA|nr:hypothetical protein Y032_0141g2238 [Ancylostoma ceylanicum]
MLDESRTARGILHSDPVANVLVYDQLHENFLRAMRRILRLRYAQPFLSGIHNKYNSYNNYYDNYHNNHHDNSQCNHYNANDDDRILFVRT